MTTSKTTIILVGIAVFTILAVWVITSGKASSAPESNTGDPAHPSLPTRLETKEQTGGNVTISATPQELTPGKPAVIQLVFDTHSVNLDFDVTQAAVLFDEKGMMYGVPVWNGDPPGGHHRKGTLAFPTPLRQIARVTLTLKNIAGIKDRMITWRLGESTGE